MNAAEDPYAAKSRECLAGAASELANGRYNNAANRAYYAAIIALLRAGLTSRNSRWDHDEVAARFASELIGRRKLYPSPLKRVLQDLGSTRFQADYGLGTISSIRAERTVRSAEGFVSAIMGKQWSSQHQNP